MSLLRLQTKRLRVLIQMLKMSNQKEVWKGSTPEGSEGNVTGPT